MCVVKIAMFPIKPSWSPHESVCLPCVCCLLGRTVIGKGETEMAGFVSTLQPEQVLPNTLCSQDKLPGSGPTLLFPHSPVTLQGSATLNLW